MLLLPRMGKSLGACMASILILGILGFHYNTRLENREILEAQRLQLDGLAARSRRAAAIIQKHGEEYSRFENTCFTQECTPEMIQDPGEYRIVSGAPLSLEIKGHNLPLQVRQVTFGLSCLHDRKIYGLIEKIMTRGPGIFQVREVIINRVNSLDTEMIGNIRAKKPATLMEAKVITTWTYTKSQE